MTSDSAARSPRAALDAARVVFDPNNGAPVPTVWNATQDVLRAVLGRPELSGQALVGEARKLNRLTLTDAHALVALATLADRSAVAPATDLERGTLREAWMALEHAVMMAPSAAPMAGVGADSPSAYAPPSSYAPSAATPAMQPPPVTEPSIAAARSSRRFSTPVIAALAAVVIAVAVGAWYLIDGRSSARAYEDGVAAYQRGAREVARTAFARAASDDASDPRPLVFLGRMSREDGDMARARRFLEAAVRAAPKSALASREMASALLADAQPELARRFYIRAIELDPTDRVAQGFLGCALYRLQRFDESKRWMDRAGPGDWSACVAPMQPMMPPGAMPPGAPYPR